MVTHSLPRPIHTHTLAVLNPSHLHYNNPRPLSTILGVTQVGTHFIFILRRNSHL